MVSINMETPDYCVRCRMLIPVRGNYRCCVSGRTPTEKEALERRPDWCPLEDSESVIDKVIRKIKTEINPYGKPFEGNAYEFGNKLIDWLKRMKKESIDE